jgi:hypothetical protein
MAERRAKYAALGLVLLTVLGVMPATAAHASDQPDSAAQQLAERHVPVVMLRAQAHDCDEDGEPFSPMNVDLVLDNQQIALRQVGNGDPTVMRGPAPPDLANLGEGFYLDFPGDSLRPGCLYEQDNNRFNEQQPAVVYAHIVQQADHPDQLALQYWLFWYYNDWNNKHEGDWEFIQLLFNASTVEEALATEPVSVGYAQHEGGERAGWNSSKLERDGERPVVYTSQRSHASYYSPALYLGRSGAEGFGCDNTRAPSTRVDPGVVVLPDEVTDPNGSLAWINFEGRWGERHSGPNNGPTGPNTKPQWTAPVTWSEGLRDSSFVCPPATHAARTCSTPSVASWSGDRASTSASSPRPVWSCSRSPRSLPSSASSCGARRGTSSSRCRWCAAGGSVRSSGCRCVRFGRTGRRSRRLFCSPYPSPASRCCSPSSPGDCRSCAGSWKCPIPTAPTVAGSSRR